MTAQLIVQPQEVEGNEADLAAPDPRLAGHRRAEPVEVIRATGCGDKLTVDHGRRRKCASDPAAVVVEIGSDGDTVARPATTADRAGATAMIARLLPELRRWSGVDRIPEQADQRPNPEDMSLAAVDHELAQLVQLMHRHDANQPRGGGHQLG